MKHLLSLSLLIFTTCTTSTMDKSYLLPDQQTIDKRLWDAGFSNFAKETKMGKKLEKQCQKPIALWSALSNIRTQYLEKYPHIIKTWDHNSMESYPPCLPTLEELMRITLYDYPNAIEALERNQWLKSSEKIVGVYRHPGMGKQS